MGEQTVAVSTVALSPVARRTALLALLIATLAIAVGIAIFRPGMSPDRVGASGDKLANQAGNAAATLRALGSSVSQIFESRSPGERLGGALANLKHARRAALHERALPKVRGPVSPLAAVVGAPVIPPIGAPPLPATPLYNVVQGTPVPTAAPSPGGGPPVVFPGAPPLPGGGGGGVIFPPVVIQPPVTPPATPPVIPPITPPSAPSVPEPSSWAMILIGFALIGHAVGRTKNRFQPT